MVDPIQKQPAYTSMPLPSMTPECRDEIRLSNEIGNQRILAKRIDDSERVNNFRRAHDVRMFFMDILTLVLVGVSIWAVVWVVTHPVMLDAIRRFIV